MKRDIRMATLILSSVQHYAKVNGVERRLLETMVIGDFPGQKDDFDYNFDLLVNDGFLFRDHGNVQLTWSGHDLLDKLVK
ncbi:hypothetical protein [Pseudomonas sp. FW300-N2A2]|uniref:hypothetical protein n=1 Tax=Pseudomonas sp. FW300-N2A2 TaxID=2751316 RepID=UPI001A91F288|nr:hypothetical protein [Pseudomonas sp. FW300-N2A2]